MSWPKLSETLTGPREMGVCQSCGKGRDQVSGMARWRECDEQDKPTHVVVNLCHHCANQIIEPHPRLYEQLGENEPIPGAMGICVTCKNRKGLSCLHPDLRANGGKGLMLTIDKPIVAMIDGVKKGKRFGYRQVIYPHPCDKCAGREEKSRE